MPLLIFLLLVFVWFGWSLPPSAWGAVPLVIGFIMLIMGLLGFLSSFRTSGATTGLGSVLVAFLGVVVMIVGLGMAGRGDVADACLGWLRAVDDKTVVVGGLVIGFILAALASRKP